MTNVFTADEVANLGKHQTGGQFHPFTCANRGDGNHRAAYGDLGALIPTVRGWICPFCDYTQDWAHGFMKAEPAGLNLAQSLEDRALYSSHPAPANSPITPTVNKNGSGTNSETPEKTCPNDPKSGFKKWNIAPADTGAAQSRAEAFDQIVAARKAYVDAVSAYNARLEFVRAERERGNWLNVDPEYAAMSEAQSAFYRTVQDLADAAIRQRAEKKR
ncbi:hypothetical protein [Sinorhizobium meliloti]|uniref:hypothetical protein n=1 Tax=Rhizobium meliloti TaxID=382 RepID=UPI001F1F426A|nr:hypothetical protein [Sinorhizobium meliloti]